MITEIQCLPSPAGSPESPYKHVEAAIAELAGSGLAYEVGALGTTVEGPADELWPLLRRVHEACQQAGADAVVSQIKVFSRADDSRTPSIGELVEPHRSS
ncbi:MAG: thiamine-binding protein [Egibacteraceae bacterium]